MSLALSAALVAYLAFVSPWLGKRSYARLERDRQMYVRMFVWWMSELWVLTGVALLIVGLSPDLSLARTGFVLPADAATTAGALTGVTLASAVAVLMIRRATRSRTRVPGQAAYEALLPRTPVERRLALAMSVTAGACEEIVYRGLLIALGVHVLGLPVPVAAGLALAVFVAGHLYQGWQGMLVVTLAGFGLSVLYLKTGSLVLPIVLHILVDARSLLLVPTSRPDRIGSTATVQE
ncbi:CPBP family intramembrane metalloprotease [Sphaerisporangium sp. NBC_01403]|uniref:CPBP family intramembrane glutamic endopeptidase n=1 Tax=Sphaerisporangium sp. NBC_01403 TaxID=2903599 RepID=UPI00324F3FBA